MMSSRFQIICALSVVLLVTTTPSFGASVSSYLNKPDEWFRSKQAREIAMNVLSWQAPEGGWPKNVDTTVPFAGERSQSHSTFDNHATTDELRYLARMVQAASERSYIAPFLRGLDHILKAQYTNGGWPQFSPPPKDKYHRHITFNDGALVRL